MPKEGLIDRQRREAKEKRLQWEADPANKGRVYSGHRMRRFGDAERTRSGMESAPHVRRREQESVHPGALHKPVEHWPNWGEPSTIGWQMPEVLEAYRPYSRPYSSHERQTQRSTGSQLGALMREQDPNSVVRTPEGYALGAPIPRDFDGRESVWLELEPNIYIDSLTGELHGGRLRRAADGHREQLSYQSLLEQLYQRSQPTSPQGQSPMRSGPAGPHGAHGYEHGEKSGPY